MIPRKVSPNKRGGIPVAKQKVAALYALLAAGCYGMSIPLSKLLLVGLPPVLLAALLYLGAGIGMGALMLLRRVRGGKKLEARLTKRELPFIVGMIALDIAAPVCLLFGLAVATPSEASLLNNFEIVTTAMLARFLFHERIGGRMWVAITLITVSTILLTLEVENGFRLSTGSVLVLLACACWGLENNCTRMLAIKDPLEIVTIKGFGSGLGSLAIALCHRPLPDAGLLHTAGIAAGRDRLWRKHLALCACAAVAWRSANQRLLCGCALHRCGGILCAISACAGASVLVVAWRDGFGRICCHDGATCARPSACGADARAPSCARGWAPFAHARGCKRRAYACSHARTRCAHAPSLTGCTPSSCASR